MFADAVSLAQLVGSLSFVLPLCVLPMVWQIWRHEKKHASGEVTRERLYATQMEGIP